MTSAADGRELATLLRNQLVDVVEVFAHHNPDAPAQLVMAGVGEFLIQFSISQVGKVGTLHLLENLIAAVEHYDRPGTTQH